MKDFDLFLDICKQYGVETTPGTGKILFKNDDGSICNLTESVLKDKIFSDLNTDSFVDEFVYHYKPTCKFNRDMINTFDGLPEDSFAA